MTIWFDVEDLIRFFQGAIRPTGIQRFSFETCSAAARLAGEHHDVRFCRRDAIGFKPIHFPALEAGIRAIADGPNIAAPPPPPAMRKLPAILVRLGRHVAPQFHRPLAQLARAGITGLSAVKALALLALAACRPGSTRPPRLGGHAFDLDSTPIIFGPGDWLINLGASWERPYGEKFLQNLAREQAGFALLAHDMIPILFPEWCTEKMTRDLTTWLDEMVPQAGFMFAVSDHTARDLQHCLARRGHDAAPALVLPAGGPACQANAKLPPLLHEPYVLMVGTIEARKNHGGMLRIWRRMLANFPPEAVPILVFAGKPGWLTADFMQQLENAGWLDGKIRFFNQPSDSALASLYQHCQFTLFPSLYEGWGLPVTESLCFGKPVAASTRAAIPEAGGNFCAYFDPDNLDEAYQVICGLIENPGQVEGLRARIAANFAPPCWEETAATLLTALGVNLQLEAPNAGTAFAYLPNPLHATPRQG